MSESERVRRVSSELRSTARGMRHEGTPAEALLWRVIRGGKLDGLKFRRQHPVGRFVLDFYCPALKLVVEIDGEIHDTQQERDEACSAELAAHGCRVLRFRNGEVLNELSTVLKRIRHATRSCSPLPVLGVGGGSQAAG